MNQKISKDDLDRNIAEPAVEAEQKAGWPGDKSYTGVLAQPMVLDLSEGANAAGLEAFLERVVALFDHFQVERGDFVKLTFELATRHVPGFRFRNPPGAPRRWPPLKYALLIRAVHRYQAGKSGSGASVSAACRRIATAGNFGKTSARAIERRYYAAIKDHEVMELANELADMYAADRPAIVKRLFRIAERMSGVQGPRRLKQ
jgi:hypothetical protein